MTLNVNGEVFLLHSAHGKMMVEQLDSSSKSDLEFWVDRELLFELMAKAKEPGIDVGQFGVQVFQSMWDSKNKGRMRFQIHASLPALVLRGYLTVLFSGGPVIMQFLAKHGFDSIGKIKKVISKG